MKEGEEGEEGAGGAADGQVTGVGERDHIHQSNGTTACPPHCRGQADQSPPAAAAASFRASTG